MSRQVFLDTVLVIADEAEARINTDLDGFVNESMGRVSGPTSGQTRERLAKKSEKFKENMRVAFRLWLDEVVKNPAVGVDPLCSSLNGYIKKSDRELIPESKRSVLLDALGAFRERVLAALDLYKDSDEQGTVPYAGNLLGRLKKEEEEGPPESSQFPFSESFKAQYRQVTGQMVAEIVEVFTQWARRVQRGSGGTILGVHQPVVGSPDLLATTQSMTLLMKEICEKWLDQGAWIGPFYRSLYAFGRSQEIVRIPGLTRDGATGFFRFGEVVRSVVEKYEPQITDLYRKERGDFVVPDDRSERLAALIYEITYRYSEILSILEDAFEKWMTDNRHGSRPQAYEANLVEAFNVYITMLRELLQSWFKTILVEEAPNVGELCVDLIKATEAYEKRERRFLLVQAEGGPKPKNPDFKLVERATVLAQALFASLGDVMVQYPDLLEDLPRLSPQDVGAESDEQKRKKEAASAARSMMDEAWRLARIEFDKWTAQVEAQPGFPGGSTWKPSAIRSFEEVRGILNETLFIWERTATFSANVFWRSVGDVLFNEAKIQAFANSSLAINHFTLPTSFSPIFVQLLPRFQAAMQVYYEADEALSPQLEQLKLRADELIDGYIKSFEEAAQGWLREQDKRVQPQKFASVAEALGTHVDFIRCLKERTLHSLVIGEVPSFESLFRGVLMYGQEAEHINCYQFKADDFIGKNVRGRATFPVLELSEDMVGKMKRDLLALLDEYPAIMNPVRKTTVIPPPAQVLEEGPGEVEPESELTDDPPAYAEILIRGRDLLDLHKEKVALIVGKTGRLTGVVRIGQECHENLDRLLKNPLEHTVRQAQMIVDQMRCFLEHHEASPDGKTLRLARRGETDFAAEFVNIGLMSGVEPGVVNPALKQAQAAVDQALELRRGFLAQLETLDAPLRTANQRIEQYEMSLRSTNASLERLRVEHEALLQPSDPSIVEMETTIAELGEGADARELEAWRLELARMRESLAATFIRERGELLGEIQRLEANLGRVRESHSQTVKERDAMQNQQSDLDSKLAAIDTGREAFQASVLAAMNSFFSLTKQLSNE